jgi:hypothetical protein
MVVAGLAWPAMVMTRSSGCPLLTALVMREKYLSQLRYPTWFLARSLQMPEEEINFSLAEQGLAFREGETWNAHPKVPERETKFQWLDRKVQSKAAQDTYCVWRLNKHVPDAHDCSGVYRATSL